MDGFVAGWSKEFHSKEPLSISYITVHVIGIHVENSFEKMGTYMCLMIYMIGGII